MPTLGNDTFQDAITRFRNRSIHAYVGHCLMFRGQILQDGEFGVQSGWDTATNEFMLEHLLHLDFLRRKITHNPQEEDIKTLEERARDLSVTLPDDQNLKSPLGDEVARPAGREFDLPYRLDGTDPNIPLLSQIDLRNVDARMFATALDQHIVEATRLDSRYATYRITPRESLMLYSSLSELFDMCVSFGGDGNRISIPVPGSVAAFGNARHNDTVTPASTRRTTDR